MSVLTSHLSAQFFLPARHKEAALKALQKFVQNCTDPSEYVEDVEEVLAATTLQQALWGVGLKVTEDQEGNLDSLKFISDRLPSDTYCFGSTLDSIARFVKAGSYLEVEEEMSPCKYTFKGNQVERWARRYDFYDGSIERAKRVFDQGELDRALGYLQQAAEDQPDYCMAWVEMAKVHARLKQWEAAEEACRKAAAAPQKLYDGHSYDMDYSSTAYAAYLKNADYLAGEEALGLGLWDLAIPFFERAAQALPKETINYWRLANAFYQTRRYAESLQAAQTLLALDPKHSYGLYFSALSLHQLARPKEALPVFAQLAKQSPTWLYVLAVYAEAAKAARDSKKVKQLAERIRKKVKNPGKTKLSEQYNALQVACLAHAYLVQEDWKNARAEAETAAAVLPHHAYVANLLGSALLMLGDLQAAQVQFEKASKLEPSWEFARYNLAQCYSRLGREEEAETLYQAVFATNERLKLRPPIS